MQNVGSEAWKGRLQIATHQVAIAYDALRRP
jgi:hypothetical protein